MALLLFGSALLNYGCADDAFLPPPENPPPGQSAPLTIRPSRYNRRPTCKAVLATGIANLPSQNDMITA